MELKHKNSERPNQKDVKLKTPKAEFDQLRKSSVLFFQVGLILVLLATYTLLEMQFEVKTYELSTVEPIDDSDTYVTPSFTIEKPVAKTKQLKKRAKKKVRLNDEIKVIKDDEPTIETVAKDLFPDKDEPVVDTPPVDEGTLNVEQPEPPVTIMSVEHVPVFPGCESQKSRDDKLKCMSKKLSKFVQRKFDSDLAGELGLSGMQRINVMFSIDKQGHVTNLKARAPHNKLEEEAKRVVAKLPRMTPGKQGNKAVSVNYVMPIVFKVQ